ncbi:hypothetical protein TcasGA2_TC033490 [Tribolium castaneum]|uniref:Endonuclease/exonuclease/phosphatase domain-containing protein n=1 Tax=Tribolium castaneum TaxID=7070 RepID=A0A139W8J6_TRICA|nr:hypothetical protein TcasGA2_TC033490 [Tribolium castaneum]
MLEDEEKWLQINAFVSAVLKAKSKEEEKSPCGVRLVSHRAPPQVADRGTPPRYGWYRGNEIPGADQNQSRSHRNSRRGLETGAVLLRGREVRRASIKTLLLTDDNMPDKKGEESTVQGVGSPVPVEAEVRKPEWASLDGQPATTPTLLVGDQAGMSNNTTGTSVSSDTGLDRVRDKNALGLNTETKTNLEIEREKVIEEIVIFDEEKTDLDELPMQKVLLQRERSFSMTDVAFLKNIEEDGPGGFDRHVKAPTPKRIRQLLKGNQERASLKAQSKRKRIETDTNSDEDTEGETVIKLRTDLENMRIIIKKLQKTVDESYNMKTEIKNGVKSLSNIMKNICTERLNVQNEELANQQHTELNANRCKAAMSLMFKHIEERKIDIALIQEPSKAMVRNKYYCDTNNEAAIIVCDIYKIKITENGNGAGYVWIRTNEHIYYSCYFSPNRGEEEFEEFIYNIKQCLYKHKGKKIVMAGDLNAKSPLWGSKARNKKGEILENIIAELGLIVVNTGTQPTFQTERGSSIIDITLCTQNMAQIIKDWKVDTATENLSDHNNITFEIKGMSKHNVGQNQLTTWSIKNANLQKITEQIKDFWEFPKLEDPNKVAEYLTEVIVDICNKNLKIQKTKSSRPPVYWWNQQVSALRTATIKARRIYTKAKTTYAALDPERQRSLEAYKIAKNNLKKEIKKAKREAWNTMLNEIDNDIWGKGYKILKNKLKRSPPPDKETIDKQVVKLFPTKPIEKWKPSTLPPVETRNLFTTEELKQATDKTKSRRAPGPDGIKPEIIKAAAKGNDHVFLEVFNRQWKEGMFPKT